MQASAPSPKQKRPVGVAVVGIVAVAGGILSLLAGMSVLSGMASGIVAIAGVVVVFGLLGVALGVGLLEGKRWARVSTIIVYLLSIGLGIVEIVYGGIAGEVGGVVRIIAGVLIPFYLTRPSAKAFLS